MNNYIELFVYLLFLLHRSIEVKTDVLILNDSSPNDRTSYTIFPSNSREKREQSAWFYPEIDKNRISCEPNIYDKLTVCSHLTECQIVAGCFESLHCPLNVKSYGSLLYNLFHLLGVNHCSIDDQHQPCSNEQRLTLLVRLLARWKNNKSNNYCNTVPMFIDEVKKEIQERCPMNFKQVEVFLENYSCLTINNPSSSFTTMTTRKNEDRFHGSKFGDPFSTTIASQIGYIDDENDLKFINNNRNLFNNTEQTVYVNDHQYYNVSYIIPKSTETPRYFVQNQNQFLPIHPLSNRHRSAFGINLKFSFPFYGHLINKVLVATGGFIYTGDLLNSALIGSTQYIAPFMANFDAAIGHNDSRITYFDNSTHFVCTWNEIFLQDQQEAGPFTFQVILQNTGNIYFNYIQIPRVRISNLNHAHRIGVSDAYLSQHSTNEHIVRVITLYDKINLDGDKIHNGVSIVFDMDQTCNTFTDCSSCLANRGKRYNCSWCDDIQKCSDGHDRSRQQWIRAQCHRLASDDVCQTSIEDTYEKNHFVSSLIVPLGKLPVSSPIPTRSHSMFQTFRTIVITLLISVLILSLLAFGVTYGYAYRHPTSAPGMWLLEHRPANYVARFKRFSGSN